MQMTMAHTLIVIKALLALDLGVRLNETVDPVLTRLRRRIDDMVEYDRIQALHHYHNDIAAPNKDLSLYLEPLQPSASFKFITHLRFEGPCHFTSKQLMQLSSMQNLGVLQIIRLKPACLVTDSVLKAWSLTDNPFPQLTVLTIQSQPAVTPQSLAHVRRFPKLAFFAVQALATDWSSLSDQAVTGWVEASDHLAHVRPHGVCPLGDPPHCIPGFSALAKQARLRNGVPDALCWGYVAYTQYAGPFTEVHLQKRSDKPRGLRDGPPVISLGFGANSLSKSGDDFQGRNGLIWYNFERDPEACLLHSVSTLDA